MNFMVGKFLTLWSKISNAGNRKKKEWKKKTTKNPCIKWAKFNDLYVF